MDGQYYAKEGIYIIDARDEDQVNVWNKCTNVLWNYAHSVIVTTVKWCAATATGICGNCTDNTTDDQVTSYGEYVGD